jgi:hypothetical protein
VCQALSVARYSMTWSTASIVLSFVICRCLFCLGDKRFVKGRPLGWVAFF